MLKGSVLCLLLLLALLLGACATGGHSALDRAGSGPAAKGSFSPAALALPAPDVLAGRSVSNSLGYVLGKQAQLASYSALTDDSYTLRLSPADLPLSGLAACAYGAFKIPVDDPGELRITPEWVTAPSAGQCWLALGNQTKNRWDWQQLSDPAAEVTEGDFADYIGPDGSVLLVLLLSSGPPADLDLLMVRTQTSAGWHYVEIYAGEAGDNDHYISPGQPFLLDGKPACTITTYAYVTDFTDPQYYLAYSDTVSGDSIDDWHVIPLPFAPSDMIAMGTGIGALYTELDEQSGDRTLYYGYASAPGEAFTKEPIATDKTLVVAKLASIGGLPGVVFSHTSETQNVVDYTPSYGSSDAISGGTWTFGLINSNVKVAAALSSFYSDPLDYNGKALIGLYDVGDNPAKYRIAVAGNAHPAAPADWTLTDLGDGYDAAQTSFIRNGKPCFTAMQYVVFPPDEINFWSYELSGNDPTVPADWTVTHFDSLGLTSDRPLCFASVGDKLCFMRITNDSATDFLDGNLSHLTLWSSESPANDAASWNQELVENNDEMFFPQLIDLNGQPAFIQTLRYQAGFGTDDRTGMRMVWAVYEP